MAWLHHVCYFFWTQRYLRLQGVCDIRLVSLHTTGILVSTSTVGLVVDELIGPGCLHGLQSTAGNAGWQVESSVVVLALPAMPVLSNTSVSVCLHCEKPSSTSDLAVVGAAHVFLCHGCCCQQEEMHVS